MRKERVGLILVILVLFLWVGAGVSEGKSVLRASPSRVKPGETILLRFSGAPGNNTDWIAIYPVGEKSENYGEWYYLEGKTSGELNFTAPQKEGDYEFHLFANWPEGEYNAITISNVIRIGVSIGTSPTPYNDVFRLSTGELITGELLSFDGSTFKIKTETGVIERKKGDVVAILIGTKPLTPTKPFTPIRSLSQWATKVKASSQYSPSGWSAQQATGEPNTSECGDIDTAWAPKSNGSESEWLELAFDTPVYATKLRVHETYNAGFLYKVEFVDVYGRKHTVWQGKDTTACPGWFEINVDQTWYLVKSVILHTQIKGYEEIDAVELTGIPISK